MSHRALHTAICDLLEIELPILQAGMGFIARAELAAAVSAAGGLGTIGAATLTPDELRADIHEVRARTDRPFGVDILFTAPLQRSDSARDLPGGVRDLVEVVFEERVPVLVSGLGNPAPVVPRAHELGIRVLSIVGNTRNARRVAAGGVDAVIAQGYDGGGHTGRVGTVALVPAVLDAVDLPVVAAGGIADGRGLAAMLGMGAAGVWLGTRFVATPEAAGHMNYKQRIAETDDEGTVRTRCFSGKPARMIRNSVTEAWEAPELQALIEPFPRQMRVVSDWLGENPYIAGRFGGNTEKGALAAGQSCAVIQDVLPAAEVVARIMGEAEEALARLAPA